MCQDDMNNKFFAYNTGLKSRFHEVIFEDFDEAELSQRLGEDVAMPFVTSGQERP